MHSIGADDPVPMQMVIIAGMMLVLLQKMRISLQSTIYIGSIAEDLSRNAGCGIYSTSFRDYSIFLLSPR